MQSVPQNILLFSSVISTRNMLK